MKKKSEYQLKKEANARNLSTSNIFTYTTIACLISATIVTAGTSLWIGHQANKWIESNLNGVDGVKVEHISTRYGLASATIKSKIVIATSKFPDLRENLSNLPPYITAIATTKFSTSTDTHLQLLGDSAKMLSDYIQRNQLKFKSGVPSNYKRNANDGSLDLPVSINTTYTCVDYFGNNPHIRHNTTAVLSDITSGTGATIKGLVYEFGGVNGKITHSLTQLEQIRVPAPHHKKESLIDIENVKLSRIYIPNGLMHTTTPAESIDSGRLDVQSVSMNTESSDYRMLSVIGLHGLSATYNIGNDLETVTEINKVKKDKVVNYPLSLSASLTAKNFKMIDTVNKNVDAEISVSGISGAKLNELMAAYDSAVNGTSKDHGNLKRITSELAENGMNIDNISLSSDSDDGKIDGKLSMRINPLSAQLISKNPLAAIAGIDLRFTASLPMKFVQKSALIPLPVINKLTQMDFIKITNNGTRLDTDIHLDSNQLVVNGKPRAL